MRPEEVAAVDLDTDDDWLVDDEEAMAAERARRSRALGVLGAVILIPATFFFVVAALQFNASRSIRSTADRWSSEVQAMSREADTVDEREAELREEVTAADGAIVGAVEAQNRVSAVMSLYVDAMNDAVRARRGGSSTRTRRALDDEVAPQLEQLQAQVEQIRAFVDAPPGADDGGG